MLRMLFISQVVQDVICSRFTFSLLPSFCCSWSDFGTLSLLEILCELCEHLHNFFFSHGTSRTSASASASAVAGVDCRWDLSGDAVATIDCDVS